MAEKKEEWEIGFSRENPRITPPNEAQTVNFGKPVTLIGQMLDGRFLIEKDLTEGGADAGGIGLVYLAEDLKLLGKKVVVKILQQAALQNENIVRKFQHEKEALIRLDDPGIVRILDSGTLADGNPFMVMEFVEGYSLRRKLRENHQLSLNECASLIEQIGNALNVAHSKKILHRDLKPENIMLIPQEEGFERVKLIDFGIARVEDSKLAPVTSIQQSIGTILYMSPEQLEGKIEQTSASDIYSFAIAAYEILTGERPFKPESIVEMYMMQSEGVRVLPTRLRSDLPGEAEKLLLSGLISNPAERPQNARLFGRELAAALSNKQQRENDSFDNNNIKTQPFVNEVNKLDITPIQNETVRVTGKIESAPENSQVQSLPSRTNAERKISTNKGWLIAGGITLPVLAILGIFLAAQNWSSKSSLTNTSNSAIISTNSNSANTNKVAEPSSPQRQLRFWLEVQKMRDGKKLDAPFESSGREIFENGYQFQLNFTPSDDGYFYLFDEGKDSAGKANFNILYPIPLPGKETPKTMSGQTIQTDWNTFGGKAEKENIWLIWTKEEQNVPQAAVKDAFKNQGKVSDQNNFNALQGFLNDKSRQNLNSEIEKDNEKKRTVLSGNGNVIVYLLELEHH